MDRGRRREADIEALKIAFFENASRRCGAGAAAARPGFPEPAPLAEALVAAVAARAVAERRAAKTG